MVRDALIFPHSVTEQNEESVNKKYASVFCLIVVWNLVTIAAERYFAVCLPLKHNLFTERKITVIFILIYVFAAPCVSLAAFQVSHK